MVSHMLVLEKLFASLRILKYGVSIRFMGA